MSYILDCYDAINLVEARGDTASKLLGRTARRVADLWNDPPMGIRQNQDVEEIFPELAEALYELLGGGPLT